MRANVAIIPIIITIIIIILESNASQEWICLGVTVQWHACWGPAHVSRSSKTTGQHDDDK